MNHSETRGLRSRTARLGAAIIGLTCTLLANTGFSQAVHIPYIFTDDETINVKHYSTEMVDPNYPDKTVMAGTAWRNGQSCIHYMYQDVAAGYTTPPVSFLYLPSSAVDARETRVVDIAVVHAERFAITALEDVDPSVGAARIKVLEVDHLGNILDEDYIESQFLNFERMYPTHSIYLSPINFSFTEERLYICGYLQENNADVRVDLEEYGTKQIFVLCYDLKNDVVVDARTYDFQYDFAGAGIPQPSGLYDYDMAMRLKHFDPNPTLYPDGRIMVTGSCNMINFDGTDRHFISGTLLLDVDPNNLASYAADPFAGLGTLQKLNTNQPEMGEYGTDFIQISSSGLYIISNEFANDMVINGGGFDFEPMGIALTWIGPSYSNPSGQPNRAFPTTDSWHWGVQIMPSITPNSITIAGMLGYDSDNCTDFFNKATWDNVNPFIADFEVGYNAATGISVATNEWNIHLSQVGTLDHIIDPYSYYRLGGWLSHIGYMPTFAARHPIGASTTDNITLNAPLMHPNGYNLTLKYIRGDEFGGGWVAGDDCLNVAECNQSFFYTNSRYKWDIYSAQAIASVTTVPVNTYDFPLPTIVNNESSIPRPLVPFRIFDCDNQSSWYKQSPIEEPENNQSIGSIKDIHNIHSLKVFPNPAKDFLQISLQTDSKGNARVELINIYGQYINTLHEGNISELKDNGKKVQLPSVASGIYVLKVYVNGRILEQRKIEIY